MTHPTDAVIAAPEHERFIAIRGDYSLLGTLTAQRHGRRDAHRDTGAREHWRAARLDSGGALLHAFHLGDRVRVRSWGPASEEAISLAGDLLGLADHQAAEFRPQQEPLRSMQRRHPGLRLPRGGSILEALVPTILAQKVVGKEAGNSYRRLVNRFGEQAQGPSSAPPLRYSPTADQWRRLAYEQFHPFGVERTRAERIRSAARNAKRLEESAQLGLRETYERLMAIPGIGPWTAAKVVFEVRGDPDAVWIGDYNLPSFVSWNLAREEKADDRRMLELLEPYSGQRARVLQLLSVAGSHPPRRAPRQALRRIERS